MPGIIEGTHVMDVMILVNHDKQQSQEEEESFFLLLMNKVG